MLEYPNLEKILELSTQPKICNKALKYFIDNFDDKYSDGYNADAINIAFLPCSEQDIYAKPSECFINSDCAVMGFNVIHQDYRFQAEKLGLHQHPNHKQLFERLIEDAPLTENKAKEIFEYLATRQDEFIESEWNILSNTKFIPTRNKGQPDIIVYKSPRGCFFKGQEMYEFIILINKFSCLFF